MGFPRNDFITEATLQGRSQQFITEALRYADVLDGKGLPVIFDTSHLAFMLNMSHRDLVHIAFRHRCFINTLPSKNGVGDTDVLWLHTCIYAKYRCGLTRIY